MNKNYNVPETPKKVKQVPGKSAPWGFHGIVPKNKTGVQSARKSLFTGGFGGQKKAPQNMKGMQEVHLYVRTGGANAVHKKAKPTKNVWDVISEM